MIINSSSQNKNCIQILENGKAYLQGMVFRIWATHPTLYWDDIKQSYAPQVRQLNSEITEMASFYLRSIKPKILNLPDRHQLEYLSHEVEIWQVSLNKPETLELAAYYYTKQYTLVQSFGKYLLLAAMNVEVTTPQETFMVQLNHDLTIHTFTN
jgi:hypothetical protein